jgi:hypothetical protein
MLASFLGLLFDRDYESSSLPPKCRRTDTILEGVISQNTVIRHNHRCENPKTNKGKDIPVFKQHATKTYGGVE